MENGWAIDVYDFCSYQEEMLFYKNMTGKVTCIMILLILTAVSGISQHYIKFYVHSYYQICSKSN